MPLSLKATFGTINLLTALHSTQVLKYFQEVFASKSSILEYSHRYRRPIRLSRPRYTFVPKMNSTLPCTLDEVQVKPINLSCNYHGLHAIYKNDIINCVKVK